MKVGRLEFTIVSIPYRHREMSAQVMRDGVTSVVIQAHADNGLVGVGESTSGSDVRSIQQALEAMTPFVIDRNPWEREAMRQELWWHGLWQFRPMTASFAWAGIDMALADICGRESGLPLYRLLGGARRNQASYFWYLGRADEDDLVAQCKDGLSKGFDVFYLKVGLAFEDDLKMVRVARDALGLKPRLRIDANAAWTISDARRRLRALEEFDIDFAEQPVSESPIEAMRELRSQSSIPLAANEGLWTEADAYARMKARVADIYCFSPYWVGSLSRFCTLANVAHLEGASVCKHTHGELGVAATAVHHAVLTIPRVVEGHQQTAHLLDHDVVSQSVPIASSPQWGLPTEPGIGVELAQDRLAEAAERYQREGQYLPYQPELLAKVRTTGRRSKSADPRKARPRA
jgi:L-alanine-DL-glutamate epimerase-like enolase superfamily enzyme